MKNDLEVADLLDDKDLREWVQDYAAARIRAYGLNETGSRVRVGVVAWAVALAIVDCVCIFFALKWFSEMQRAWVPVGPGSGNPFADHSAPSAVFLMERPHYGSWVGAAIGVCLIGAFLLWMALIELLEPSFVLRGVRRRYRTETRFRVKFLHEKLSELRTPLKRP